RQMVYLNDKKKLYFMEPFARRDEQVVEAGKPVPPPPKKTANQKGGTITIWYNIRDTGERKQLFGFTARHVWTSQKIKPSADACSMKDSLLLKTDGWYIDLPEFNCPHDDADGGGFARQPYQPDCMDRYITHSSGKGKLGFPLVQTTTIIVGNRQTEMTTSIETLEFSTARLDSMLFEIPPGYGQAGSRDELQDPVNMTEVMKNMERGDEEKKQAPPAEAKKPGTLRIGVLPPAGNSEVQPAVLQSGMINNLTANNIQAVAINSEEEARQYQCDYVLGTQITGLKQATNVGGGLKAIKKGNPNVAGSYHVQATLTLKQVDNAATKTQKNIDGKYEGRMDAAAGKALEEGCKQVLNALRSN
ncbi:MAG: hypothetical protein ACO1NX_06735, partial [Chitinophagaceae bacterium]